MLIPVIITMLGLTIIVGVFAYEIGYSEGSTKAWDAATPIISKAFDDCKNITEGAYDDCRKLNDKVSNDHQKIFNDYSKAVVEWQKKIEAIHANQIMELTGMKPLDKSGKPN